MALTTGIDRSDDPLFKSLYYALPRDSDPAVFALRDRSRKSSASQLLPDIIELMRSQMENVLMQMNCHWLINVYSSIELTSLKSPLRRSLTEILLSTLKVHRQDNVIVENIATVLLDKIKVFPAEIKLYLKEIDCLLEIILDETNLTTTARKSMLRLLSEIFLFRFHIQIRLIDDHSGTVARICRSIRNDLAQSQYDDNLEVNWDCLYWFCKLRAKNIKRLMNEGGIDLFMQCYKKFGPRDFLVMSMTGTVMELIYFSPVRKRLLASGIVEFLWRDWSETKNEQMRSFCRSVFSYFHSEYPTNWPMEYPTLAEVENKLNSG